MTGGPSATAVGLIVGTGTVTIGAMWATIGYFARRFLSQQSSNHSDTLEVRDAVREIGRELPRLGLRITRLEAVAALGGALAAWMAYRKR